jgi:hypothetical protein
MLVEGPAQPQWEEEFRSRSPMCQDLSLRRLHRPVGAQGDPVVRTDQGGRPAATAQKSDDRVEGGLRPPRVLHRPHTTIRIATLGGSLGAGGRSRAGGLSVVIRRSLLRWWPWNEGGALNRCNTPRPG